MQGQFDGKNALITGASSGIGAEIARELARRGAHVIVVARREDPLCALVSEIADGGGSASSFVCDVTDEDGLKQVVSQLKTSPLDVLVNNAGKELIAPLQVQRMSVAQETMALNVLAMANVTRLCLRVLNPNAAIVNMASLAGLRGTAGMSLYSASKGAVIAWTQSVARELAGRGIRVNAVAPGIVRTDMTDRMFSKYDPAQVEALENSYPLGFGRPIDVARAVAFLASDDAAWITGQTLVVDGGCSA